MPRRPPPRDNRDSHWQGRDRLDPSRPRRNSPRPDDRGRRRAPSPSPSPTPHNPCRQQQDHHTGFRGWSFNELINRFIELENGQSEDGEYIESLEGRLQELNEYVHQLKTEKASERQRAERLESELIATRERGKTLKTEKEALRTEKETLRNEKQILKQERDHYIGKVHAGAQNRATISTLQKAKQRLEDDLADERQHSRMAIETLRSDLAEERRRAKAFKTTIETLQGEKVNLEYQNQCYVWEINKKSGELKVAEADRNKLAGEVGEFKEEEAARKPRSVLIGPSGGGIVYRPRAGLESFRPRKTARS